VTIRFQLALLSTVLLAGNEHAQSAETAPDTMAARVLACASCHGDKGQGTNDDYFPRLAGKPAGYLYNQLIAFRDGRRKYPPMNYLLEFLPNPYLRAMADYFASEQPPFPPPATPTVSAAMLARGESLATRATSPTKFPLARIATGHPSPAWSRRSPDCSVFEPTTSAPSSAHGAMARAPRPLPIACRSLPDI
jgi:cytochrome c553